MSKRIALIAGLLAATSASWDAGIITESTAARRDDAGLAVVTDATVRGHVAVLASDDYRGRFPGTVGEDSTLAYLERQYRSLGLEPVVNGSYRQRVPLVRRTVLPTPTIRLTRVSVAAADREEPPAIRWGDDLLLSSTLLDDTLSIRGAEIVFAGYGISAPELDWDDYEGLDCRGKVVLALSADPGRSPADSTLFGGRALTRYGLPLSKQEMAAAHGAVGILLIHDQEALGYPFDILTASAGRAKYDLVPGPNTTRRPAMSGTLRKGVVVDILESAGLDPGTLFAAAGRRGFHGRPLGIAIDVAARLHIDRAVSYNLLGLLRGVRRPDEVVVYSAHWDHMGIGVPVNGDSIYNGAVDNASGTAALLTLAKAFRASGTPPARSVLFWATTCEEQGLLGAYYYADNPIVPLAKTVAVINMDSLFPFGPVDEIVVTGFGWTELDELLARAAAVDDRRVVPYGMPEAGAFYRSDAYPMARKGVPAIFAVGNPQSDLVLKARFDRYVLTGYHKPADELTAEWDTRCILQDIRSFYRLGRGLTDGTSWPNWPPTSEFRAEHDAMRR